MPSSWPRHPSPSPVHAQQTPHTPSAQPCFLSPCPLTGSVDSEWGVPEERGVLRGEGESPAHCRSRGAVVPGPARQPGPRAQLLGNDRLGVKEQNPHQPRAPVCLSTQPLRVLSAPSQPPQGQEKPHTLPHPLTCLAAPSSHLGFGKGSWSLGCPAHRPRAPRGGWPGAAGSCWPGAALQSKELVAGGQAWVCLADLNHRLYLQLGHPVKL